MLVHFFDYAVIAVCFSLALILGYAFFKVLENAMLDFWALIGSLVVFSLLLIQLTLWSDTSGPIMRVRGAAAAHDAVRNAKQSALTRPFDDCARSVAARESYLGTDLLARKIVNTCR